MKGHMEWLVIVRKVLLAGAALLGALTGAGTVVPQIGEPLADLLQPAVEVGARRSVSCWNNPEGLVQLMPSLPTFRRQ